MATTKKPQDNQNLHNPGQLGYEDLVNKEHDPDRLKSRDEQHVEDSTDSGGDNLASRESTVAKDNSDGLSRSEKEPSQEHENQLGRGYRSTKPIAPIWNRIAGTRKKKLLISTMITSIVVGVVVAILSLLPFEALTIKHTVTDRIGGVESRTYRIGRTKFYNKMFFFDEKGNYTGAKVGGVRRLMLENRKTAQMTKVLNDNGYKLVFDQNSGKIKALEKVDSKGNVLESYKSNSEVERAWTLRDNTILENILREEFPDKSDFWYSTATRQMYRRLGLTRENWLKDYVKGKTGITAVENLEFQFREALRQKLFGKSSGASISPIATKDPKDPNNPTPDESLSNKAAGEFNGIVDPSAAEALRQQQLADVNADNPSPGSLIETVDSASSDSFSFDQALKSAPSSVTSSITGLLSPRTLNVLGADQMACQANSTFDAIIKGARILRSYELMKFSLAILTMSDAIQNGKSVDSRQVKALMNYLNSTDKNGRNMFASSGWIFWNTQHTGKFSANKYDKNQLNAYSVGGGLTGTLQLIRNYINGLGAGANCKVVNNPYVSFGGLVAGIGLGIFSGGGSIVVQVGAQFFMGVAYSYVLDIAKYFITPMVAGTVVNGLEKGTAVGNAFISGAETLTTVNGANTGMRPLTKSQFKTAYASVQQDQKSELALMPLKDRLFSLSNSQTFASLAMSKIYSFKSNGISNSFFSVLPALFGNINLFSNRSLAAQIDDSGCTDSDLSSHDLASTPFCNPVMGIPDSVMNNPTLQPDTIDDTINSQAQNVDDNGQPIDGSPYAIYLKQCTAEYSDGSAGIDIIHKNLRSDNDYSNGYTDRCSNDLFNTYRLYMTIGQSQNDMLEGNLTE